MNHAQLVDLLRDCRAQVRATAIPCGQQENGFLLSRINDAMFDLLTEQFDAWCADQKIVPQDADELILRDDLTAEQRQWLSGFITSWEDVCWSNVND